MSVTPITFQLGDKSIELNLPESANVSQLGTPTSLENLESLISEQLDAPMEYPALMASIIEDDQVVIGLEDNVPGGPSVAAEVAKYLIKNGVAPDKIKILIGTSQRARLDSVQLELQRRSVPEVQLLLHDASTHDSHAYVAASKSGDPIYVERELIDADVSIPIYCVRNTALPHASDPFGIAPTFTDGSTQERWNSAWIDDSLTDRHEHEALGREIGWLSGIHFAIAIVPTSTGDFGTVVAGQPEAVHREGLRLIERNALSSNGQSDLVVSIVEGPTSQQTWMSIARAVTSAEAFCTPAARIVICCDVKTVTRGVRNLHSDDPIEQANKRLLKSGVEDAFPAAVLRLASYRRSIYLFSSLNEEDVENLGLAYIKSETDIQHLMEQAKTVQIVRAAQF